MVYFSLFLVLSVFRIDLPAWAQSLPNAPSAQKAKTQLTQTKDSGWPRTFTSGTDTFTIYQPQVDKWDGNHIDLYSAVELKTGKDSAAKYGVVWFQARTEVDKVNRLVTLDQMSAHKGEVPGGGRQGARADGAAGEEAAGRDQDHIA